MGLKRIGGAWMKSSERARRYLNASITLSDIPRESITKDSEGRTVVHLRLFQEKKVDQHGQPRPDSWPDMSVHVNVADQPQPPAQPQQGDVFDTLGMGGGNANGNGQDVPFRDDDIPY